MQKIRAVFFHEWRVRAGLSKCYNFTKNDRSDMQQKLVFYISHSADVYEYICSHHDTYIYMYIQDASRNWDGF